jgi:hypothetical protein
MSIQERINTLCSEQRLIETAFQGPFAIRRTLYLSPEVYSLISGTTTGMSPEKLGRWLQARAWFEHFVDGKRITLKSRPKSFALMARLEPPEDEIWEVRENKPRPSLRVLGSFVVERDTFVALTPSEHPQGRRNSSEWQEFIGKYKAHWEELFHGYEPLRGSYPDDYLSNAIASD